MKSSLAMLAAFAVFIPLVNANSQAAVDVISIDGSAKVQHVGKKDWETVSPGSKLRDNDIVETYFQARMVMQFGRGNTVILGSDSKALVNIREQRNDSGIPILNVNLTLFSGGCVAKAILNSRISVYTSDAVGETDKGSFSTVVEPKTGETRFQSLGGSIKARNIAQKENSTLSSGQTTMIFPDKEPTAPLYITVRHVAELKSLFGNDYIESELGAAHIRPTEENAGATGETRSIKPAEAGTYKRQFSANRIWGAVLSDRETFGLQYDPISTPDVTQEHKIVLEENNAVASAEGRLFPSFALVPSYSSPMFGAGLRIPFAANYTRQIRMYDFGSVPGYLDLIDHVRIGPFFDSTFVTLGPIDNYTIGDGIVVDGYNNRNPYSVFHPLGLVAQAQVGSWSLQGFIGDISSLSPGGIHVLFDPGVCRFGAGYFFDADQNYLKGMDSASFRFVKIPKADSNTVELDSAMSAFIYDLDFAADVVSTYAGRITLSAGFAQKIAGLRTDGFVIKAPTIEARWSSLCAKAGISTESGRLIASQFYSSYASTRVEMMKDTGASSDTLLFTQNTILSSRRFCSKLELFFGMNPVRGAALAFSYKQNLYDTYPIAIDSNYSGPDLTIGLSCTINDSLWRPIKYGTMYLEETHGGLYPRTTVFPSWGFRAGADVVTNPILFGVGFSAGFSWSYLDMKFNNVIDPSDKVAEFHLGLRYGFL